MCRLQAKIRRYQRMRAELPKLEREIKQMARDKQPDLKMIPRLERIIAQFGPA